MLSVSLTQKTSLFQLFTVDLHRDFANAGPARYGLGLCHGRRVRELRRAADAGKSGVLLGSLTLVPRPEIVILFGLARRTARKSRKCRYFA